MNKIKNLIYCIKGYILDWQFERSCKKLIKKLCKKYGIKWRILKNMVKETTKYESSSQNTES